MKTERSNRADNPGQRVDMRRNIDAEIQRFIDSVSDMWTEESLDGDETAEIARRIGSELDFRNGNA